MAALDFPNSPSVGQIFPSPAIAGTPQYKWDGTVWAMVTSSTFVGVPSGTVMLFCQPTAPTGWTQVTTHNDKALRVVSGTGGGSGGTNPFSTVMAQTVVGNHSMTVAESATVTSTGSNAITVYPAGSASFVNDYFGPSGQYTSTNNQPAGTTGQWDVTGTASGYNIGVPSANNNISVTATSTTAAAHNHSIQMQIQYVDIIIASLN
jgi:hypothetical protein